MRGLGGARGAVQRSNHPWDAVTAGVTLASQGRYDAPLNWLRGSNVALPQGCSNHGFRGCTMNGTTKLAGPAALVVLAVACNLDERPLGLVSPSFDRSHVSGAPLVLHVIGPQATDPAIDKALDAHFVWLDTTAQSNHKLLVFLPGTAAVPGRTQLVEQEAARLGYHVIGLMYQNDVQLAICGGVTDPTSCYENARLEILHGVDRSDLVDVSPANSIDNRLTKLLQFLASSFPEEGWSRFLADDKPKWSRIAVGGLSQGGGQAAMIAKLRLVARVVMFSSPPDSLGTEAPPWLATHVTPSDRYWGLAHDRDVFFRPILAGWDSLGMAAFGDRGAPETSAPPYGFTHMLVTDLLPRDGSYSGLSPHRSTVNDQLTPLNPDGTCCALRDAWRYLLTARSAEDEDAEVDEAEPAIVTASGDATVTEW